MKRVALILAALAVLLAAAPAAGAADYRPWKRAMVAYWKAEKVSGKRPAVVLNGTWGKAARAMATRIERWDRLHTPTVVVFDGNSLTANIYPRLAAAQLTGVFTWYNTGVPGQSLGDMLVRGPEWVDAHVAEGERSILVFWNGTIELCAWKTPAQILDLYRQYSAARRAAGWDRIICLSTLPFRWQDRSDIEPSRRAWNDLLRAHWREFADGFVDIAADPVIGKLGTTDDLDWYIDGIHLSPAGYARVARAVAAKVRQQPEPASGRFDAGLRSLLRPYLR